MHKRKFSIESLESRHLLAANLVSAGWDGPGQGRAELTYYIGNAPTTIDQASFRSAIESALSTWSSVADIRFTPTHIPGLRDSLDFTSRNLDGTGGTLAQAYFPDDINPAGIAGDVQFDLAERWEIGNAQGGRAYDLVAVAVHEIGHALGLDHASAAGSILRPTISPNAAFSGLSAADAAAIQQLYAPKNGTVEPSQPPRDVPTNPAENPRIEILPRIFVHWNPWNRFRWGISFRLEGLEGGATGRIDAAAATHHNDNDSTDVNRDAATTAIDALLVINALNLGTPMDQLHDLCDTNNDAAISPVDALLVINRLNNPDAAIAPADGDSNHDEVPGDPAEDGADDPIDEIPDDSDPGAGGPEENECVHPEQIAGAMLGQLGPRAMHALERVFAALDENEDQSLTEDEVPPRVWSYLIGQGVDADQSSSITLEEIKDAIRAKRMEQFQAIDTNEDGKITQDEVSARRWRWLLRFDANEDGAIDADEFATWPTAKPVSIPPVPMPTIPLLPPGLGGPRLPHVLPAIQTAIRSLGKLLGGRQ
jgi:Ca2+-binding EF-hand superfamily protein